MKNNKYENESARISLAYTLAAESMVLLKNTANGLPLSGGNVAFFGRASYRPNLGGMGSGMSFAGKEIPKITDSCRKRGVIPVEPLEQYYDEIIGKEVPYNPLKELFESGTDLVASGIIYDIFGKYNGQTEELDISEELMRQAAARTNTAILTFGRSTGGEECDRHVEDDYELLACERKLIQAVCTAFPKVIVILNCIGLTDTSWVEDYGSIQAVIYMGATGEQATEALADLIVGRQTPSGKLAFTIARSYTDYPTAKDFSFDKDHPENILEYKDYGLDAAANGSEGFVKSPVTVYREGLYMGYRYFDSFGKEVLYPFGYGLSYADFEITEGRIAGIANGCVKVEAGVKNTSDTYPGKEVVQVYVSAPDGRLEKPYQSLAGYVKTELLKPGETQKLSIDISVKELSSYDEQRAAWILEKGMYDIRVGNSSRDTFIAGRICVNEEIVVEQLSNVLSLQEANAGKIAFLSPKDSGAEAISYEGEDDQRSCAAVTVLDKAYIPALKNCEKPQLDVEKIDAMLDALSDDELMALCVGYGPGLPFGGMGSKAPATLQDDNGRDLTVNTHKTGNMGYVSPAIPRVGLPSAFYKDGPASVGMTAWPTGMILACAFNPDLCYEFGLACGWEALSKDVDSWLAPALNLHRSPIGGRNFEYFSEDPFVAGTCGRWICQGAIDAGVTCCPKHYALNEQETYRRGSTRKSFDAADSVVTERTARELYLKPFEMVIRNVPVTTIMTSFNKINGTFAGGSYDLCTKVLREEWGYQGVVVTDWGDMDIVVDGADAVAAGNDVVMPGGPPVIAQIKAGFEDGRITRKELETAVRHLLQFVMTTKSYEDFADK